jgi:hypothetical protein
MAQWLPTDKSNPANDVKEFPTGSITEFNNWGQWPIERVGSTRLGVANTVWQYVKATAALPVGTCAVSATFDASPGAGFKVIYPAPGAGFYGWVQKSAAAF